MSRKALGEIDSLARSSRHSALIGALGLVTLVGSLAASLYRVSSAEEHLSNLQEQAKAAESALLAVEQRNGQARREQQTLTAEISKLDETLVSLKEELAKTPQSDSSDIVPKLAAAQKTLSSIQNTNQVLAKVSGDSELAKRKERDGFELLIAGDFRAAAVAFQDAENALSGYHSAHEIAKLLRSKNGDLANPVTQASVRAVIVKKLAYGAPRDLVERLAAVPETK